MRPKERNDFKCRFVLLALLMFVELAAFAQQVKVSGTVTDPGGEPLIGVTVRIANAGKDVAGSITDMDGKYTISVPASSSLIFSYIGFESTTQVVGGRTTINVTLHEKNDVLNEVVVIGYGTMDKKELTSAISHVSSKDFTQVASVDPSMMIQGKVPGVSITNTGAGDPNNQASIQIRGVSSRAAGLGPLIVIDGVPGGNLTNINPNDIASFDILKDGAASAIYGTRGSNGVILVTTKKGARDGAIHTSYNGTVSFDVIKKELDMLSADEYRANRIASGSGYDLGGSTDWLDEVSRVGVRTQHTLTLSGGNSKSNYRASIDYRNAEGIDRYSGRKEYGGRASINHTTKSGLLTFGLNIAPRIAYRRKASWDVFRNAIEANPTTPIMNPQNPAQYYNFKGQAAGYNPVELENLDKNTGTTKLLDWDASAKLNLFPLLLKNPGKQMLTTQLTFADHQYDNYNQFFRPSTSTLAINAGRSGEASQDYSKSSMQSVEWITNYSNSFGNHNVKLMLGYSYEYNKYSGLNANNKDFPNDALEDNNLGSGTYAKDKGEVDMGSYMNDNKLIAFFGRVSYDWKGRYMLTASLRHEGSSKFGANHKWGNFPAVSVGWRISDEPFMKEMKSWLADLKLRADYGVTGNQDFDSYKSLNTMQGFGYYMYNGKFYQVWGPGKNVNPDLHWEKGKNWNIGLDWTLFQGRLYGSFNYYNRKQQDLLGDYNVSVPPYLFTTTFVNVGTMRNNGFEFDITWNAIKTKNFSYTLNVIGATMANKFVSFSNNQFVGQDYYDVVSPEDPYPFHTLQRIEKGKRIGNFYMLKYAGVDPQGRWVVYDKNGDKVLADNATDDDRQYVGNGLPKFTGSMTHTFRYKNIDLSLFFQTALGFDIFNIHDFYYGTKNFQGNVMDKAYSKNKIISQNPIVCDYFLEPGDYLKLSSVNIGYTLPLKSKFIESLRIYAVGSNLFTWTQFSGVDPSTYQVNGLNPGATGSRSYYPSTRQFMLGMQVDF
ncbi:TonB-dependent receptor plug [Hallella multisaccharivorax DSM 17128]|uniref:TonB-dependent receptor plug n=1 Tax=Hallella multisaccharivorax DSM 17128 TaxID=688246 RepID=F8N665_9BACT|nr:TonB-dependent receptor plug [Hallella multisaccharivorax DSM 17128]